MQEDNLLIKHLKDYNELYTVVFQSPISIIAESGGTKTDWRIKNGNEIIAFETCNFHPRTIEKAQNEVIQTLIKTIPKKSSLFFYGSGCLQKENQEIIKYLFQPIDFKTITIQSDLIAAGKSIYGTGIGYVGILGTGSVLCKYNNEQIEDLLGGHGYLLGDEGSGYYFGKLAIQKYLLEECTSEYKEFIETSFGDRSSILATIYGNEGKLFLGNIRLESQDSALQLEIENIHRENIELFLSKYLPKNKTITEISFIGSYALYNEKILKEELNKRGILLNKIIQKPIDELMKFHF
jgi:glucosamine kinase